MNPIARLFLVGLVGVIAIAMPVPSAMGQGTPDVASDEWGDEDGYGDEADDFEFQTGTVDIAPPPLSSNFGLTGFARTRAGIWLERLQNDPGSTFRQSLDLQARGRLRGIRYVAAMHGEYDFAYAFDDRYQQPTKETYAWQIISGEQFASIPLGHFDITLGRQIVAWGEGDVFSPLDLVNPRDLREPGLSDLDDIRLAVLATRLGYFTGPHRLELMVVHEGHTGLRPDPLAEYSPLRTALLDDPRLLDLLGDKTLRYTTLAHPYMPEHWSYYLRWLYAGEGLDLGLYAARVLDRQGTIALPDAAAFGADSIEFPLVHKTYDVLGHSGAKPSGDWLLKWEGVFEMSRPQNAGTLNEFPPILEQSRVDLLTGMIGVTYTGWRDITVGVEGTRGFLLSDGANLLFPVEALAMAARVSYLTLRERLRFDAAVTTFGDVFEFGGLGRFEATYAYQDGLKFSAAIIHFNAGTDGNLGPFTGLDDLDQFITRLRWDFTLL